MRQRRVTGNWWSTATRISWITVDDQRLLFILSCFDVIWRVKGADPIRRMKYLLLLTLALPVHAATTAVGSTGALDRARLFQDRVAVPGHDDTHLWDSSFDLGASFTRGNSDTSFITASATLAKEFSTTEFFGNITYAYGEESNNVTEDEAIVTGALNYFLTKNKRVYVGARLDGQHDDLAGIDYRLTASTFVGYYFIKRENESLELSAEVGGGGAAESQGGIDTHYALAYFGQRFNYWVTDFTRVYQAFAIFDQQALLEQYQIIAEAGIETFLSDSLSYKAYLQNQYESVPAEGRKSTDIRLVMGLSYKF